MTSSFFTTHGFFCLTWQKPCLGSLFIVDSYNAIRGFLKLRGVTEGLQLIYFPPEGESFSILREVKGK